MSATMEEPQQIKSRKRSSTTLDPTTAPQDELLMTFNSAASASDSSRTFVAQTKGPDLFTLPLSSGLVVAGEIIDDASTVSAPFLPGDLILACLLPPKPLLLLPEQGSTLRLRIPTRNALELPDGMSADQATTYLTALIIGAAILKQELHIPILRTPTASPCPAEEGGVGTYNHKRILLVGGETELGAALTQLLHRALPEAKILVTTTTTTTTTTSSSSSSSAPDSDNILLRQRHAHLTHLGAKSALDTAAEHLSSSLPPSVDIIIHAGLKDAEPVRKDMMNLLEGLAKFVDCKNIHVEAAVEKLLDSELDCVTSLHEMLMRAAGVFSQTVEMRGGGEEKGGEEEKARLEREDSGVELEDL